MKSNTLFLILIIYLIILFFEFCRLNYCFLFFNMITLMGKKQYMGQQVDHMNMYLRAI